MWQLTKTQQRETELTSSVGKCLEYRASKRVCVKLGITEAPQSLSAPTYSAVGESFLAVRLVTKSSFGQDYKV